MKELKYEEKKKDDDADKTSEKESKKSDDEKSEHGDKEGEEDQEDSRRWRYSFSTMLVSSDNHVFFEASDDHEEDCKRFIIGSKEKLPKFYDQLRELPKEESGSLKIRYVDFNHEAMFEKFLIEKTLKRPDGTLTGDSLNFIR